MTPLEMQQASQIDNQAATIKQLNSVNARQADYIIRLQKGQADLRALLGPEPDTWAEQVRRFTEELEGE